MTACVAQTKAPLRSIHGKNEMQWPEFRSNQSGQATIEYLIVFPLLLLLLLASLQFIFIYEAKTTLDYAAFAGTRAGALNNGSMSKIQDGVSAGLAPLFAHNSDIAKGIKEARLQSKQELNDNKLARIEIINPTSQALNDFGQGSPKAIPNDNLMYRSTSDGATSGMNVQDANLLKVRVTYCAKLIVPLVNVMIYGIVKGIAPATVDQGPAIMRTLKLPSVTGASGLCARDGTHTDFRIPISSEAIVRMQTPFKDPGKWTAP